MKKVIVALGMFLAGATAFASGYDYSPYYSSNFDTYYQNVPSPVIYNGGYNAGYQADYQACATAIDMSLSVGSQGEEVLTLQDYLHAEGYLIASPNGYFGSGTKAAVMLFQRDHDISVTGKVGPVTREALNAAICGDNSNSYASRNDSAAYFGNGYNFNKLPAVSDTVTIPTTVVTSFDAFAPQTANTSVITPSSVAPIAPFTSTITTPVASQNGISYYPYDPFGKSPLPLPATLTINPPLPHSVYKEGDTMTVAWTVTNANVSNYEISLKNNSTSQSRVVSVLPGSQRSISFTLSKELLDAVCGSNCDASMQQNFSLVVKATLSQAYQDTSVLTARADSLIIVRPYYNNQTGVISLTPSKNPVTSGETITLNLTVPTYLPYFQQYSSLYWKIRAICLPGSAITVNGQACGTESYVYQPYLSVAPSISATIVNSSWGTQQVTFEATAYTSYGGTQLGQAVTTVTVNK